LHAHLPHAGRGHAVDPAPADQIRSRRGRTGCGPIGGKTGALRPRPTEDHVMTRLHRHLSILLALCLVATAPLRPATAAANEHGSTEAADDAIAESVNAILQGDSARALRALAAVPAGEYRGFDAQYRACMFTRFDRASPPWLAGGIDDPL